MIIGVLGGGQLGWMLGKAGRALGIRCRFLDPNPESPARNAGELVVGAFDDPAALRAFAAGLDAVTYEFENVPVDAAKALSASVPIHPAVEALAVGQDRLLEKEFFARLGVPTPAFRGVDDARALNDAARDLGLPLVAKTRRMGYDGRGQVVVRSASEAASAWEALGRAAAIAEAHVPFDRELSSIAARGRDGDIRFYALAENHHEGGILRVSLAPAPSAAPGLRAQAEAYAARVLERLDYVGVLAIEWFERGGALLANEMAPRVHNSGHGSIEGARTSQFENHLRAVAGMPLGAADALGVSAMINLIGSVPDLTAAALVEGTYVHLYGKTPRPGRKLGHVTVTAPGWDALRTRLERLGDLGALARARLDLARGGAAGPESPGARAHPR
jgi:5-(carboxyamino)imidazole ribonucleotide synthase